MCLCDKLFCLHDGRVWNASPARYQGMTEAAAQRGDFIVEGHRLSFATTGPRALDRLCGLIDGARSELLLLYYIFAADAVGHRVRDAIGNARQRGVDVSLIIDDFGSEDTPESFFAPLAESGVQVCRFHPRLGRRYLLRNHQKVAIADASRAIIGGFNVEDEYFMPDHPESWHDYGVEVEGPSIAHLADYYRALFRWSGDPRGSMRTIRKLVQSSSQTRGAVRWLIGGPTLRPSGLVRTLKSDFQGARDLMMSMAYFAPNPGFLRRLGRIGERGAATVVTAARSDNNVTIDAARHCYRRLLRRGVKIYEYGRQRLHAKLIVADDITYIGSANFDVRSLYLNMELMLRVDDPAFAGEIRSRIAEDIAVSERIDRARYRQMSNWWRKLKWTIAYFIVAILDFNVARRLNLGND